MKMMWKRTIKDTCGTDIHLVKGEIDNIINL